MLFGSKTLYDDREKPESPRSGSAEVEGRMLILASESEGLLVSKVALGVSEGIRIGAKAVEACKQREKEINTSGISNPPPSPSSCRLGKILLQGLS